MTGPADRRTRCSWGASHPLYLPYHDTEWGVPLHDDQRIFEMLVLEGAQAGLSWSAIRNARAFLAVQAEFGSFDAYIWRFVDGRPKQNRWRSWEEVPARTEESDALSKDLKSRGFSFVGSTICYAHMQATGMVNDHQVDCFRHEEVRELGREAA